MKKYYTIEEINEMRKLRIILICKNKVYDVTEFIHLHPGNNIIINNIKKDNIKDYKFHSKKGKKIWKKFFIGYLKK
jgi:cytochrome b involved in lipid metabolism